MVSLPDISAALERISPYIIRTPLVYSPTFSEMSGARVYLKLETLQKAGSFKVRGATNKILSCMATQGNIRRVVAASAGNHAQGVAVAAHSAGIPATIVMPEWSALAKQEATKAYGAQVLVSGGTLEESLSRAKDLITDGTIFIHPYDDDAVVAGQGTIALEILSDLPETDLIIVPVGGGGLAAGIAVAAKEMKPEITIIGAQTMECPSFEAALRHGSPFRIHGGDTIADGIRVAETGLRTFPVLQHLVDRHIVVTEEEIADAILLLLERKHVIAEGAGAVSLAALMHGRDLIKPGSNVVLVISGGNIDSPLLFRIIRHSLARHGRLMRFSVLLDDQPGVLARILTSIAREQGNILHVHHVQGERDTTVLKTRVYIELETRGWDHIRELTEVLAGEGFLIRTE